jgi:flagellar biosynthesis/type III secretory pathway protein FliH
VAPESFHELFDPPPASLPGVAALVPNYSLLLVDLAHLSNEDLKTRALAAFPTLALWALRDARNATQLLRNLDHWAATFRLALRTPHGLEAVRQLLRYIALVTDDQQSEEFRAKLSQRIPEAREAIMTYGEKLIQQGLQQGLEAGRQEGRQEGLVEGQIQLLEKLLTLKFGALPSAYGSRLHAATEAQLVRYAERTLTAQHLDEVFAES